MAMPATLSVQLSPEQEEYVASKVASGRYSSVAEVVRESLRFLELHEALLEVSTAELKERIAVGVEQADRGDLRDGEEVFRELEARLASANSAP